MKRIAGMVFAVLAVSSAPCWADTVKQFLQLYNSEDGQGQALAVVKIVSVEAGVHQANEYLSLASFSGSSRKSGHDWFLSE